MSAETGQTAEEYKRQRDLLGQVLGRILVAQKVVNPMDLTGPELLMAAEDYADHLEAENSDPENKEREKKPAIRCHAGSQYSTVLVCYEKPGRDKRVFVVYVADDDVRFDLYCCDLDIQYYAPGDGAYLFNGRRVPARVWEIDGANVMSETTRIVREHLSPPS